MIVVGIIGKNKDIGMHNLYTYVVNNPVIYSDSPGKFAITISSNILAVWISNAYWWWKYKMGIEMW